MVTVTTKNRGGTNPYEALRLSITRQAIADWYLARQNIENGILQTTKIDFVALLNDCEEFFRSGEFQKLTGAGITGEEVLRLFDENFYDYCGKIHLDDVI